MASKGSTIWWGNTKITVSVNGLGMDHSKYQIFPKHNYMLEKKTQLWFKRQVARVYSLSVCQNG